MFLKNYPLTMGFTGKRFINESHPPHSYIYRIPVCTFFIFLDFQIAFTYEEEVIVSSNFIHNYISSAFLFIDILFISVSLLKYWDTYA